MIYIDDFDIIVYTTVFPKSSNIYISHSIPQRNNENTGADQKQNEETTRYKFLATLKGHKNSCPPTICYVEETGCIISGEKNDVDNLNENVEKNSPAKARSPEEEKQHELLNKAKNLAKKKERKTEILIWNIQKDLIHMMQANPPWVIQCTHSILAHDASILDIIYLPSAQLIASSSADQTIRFFDPVARPHLLTDPQQFPEVAKKIGDRFPRKQEFTETNVKFSEVKRIYLSPSSCYKMQVLSVTASGTSKKAKELGEGKIQSGKIEWLVAMKLTEAHGMGTIKQVQGSLTGFGIERVKLTIPAVRHDDPIPDEIKKECEGEVEVRRKKATIVFQSMLPHNLEIFQANATLQNVQMQNVEELFKEALLNRINEKYMNPKPLREVFKILLELPERKKYEDLIKANGKNSTLSVSEVYFCLKKHQLIHPTNLSQVIFTKEVKAIQDDQSKANTDGIKKWNSEALNVFATYIQRFGIGKEMLEFGQPDNDYLTRSEFVEYLKSLSLGLEEAQLESVASKVDPLDSDKITVSQLQTIFSQEIKHHNLTMFRIPNPVFSEIRNNLGSGKKLRLQEALGTVDNHGDGYLTKKQFFEGFEKAQIEIDKETLDYIFEMVSEKYTPREQEKVLNIAHFLKQLLTKEENKEYNEIEEILNKISSSMSYRGIAPEKLFTDVPSIKLDLTAAVSKTKEVLTKAEFINRIEKLHILQLSSAEISKLANYLAVNVEKEKIQAVYMQNFLHHLRNLSAPKSDVANLSQLMAVLCGKLLVSESRFRKQCFEVSNPLENRIEPADLRSVLLANGVLTKHADLFIEQIMGSTKQNIDDLVAKMRVEAILHYNPRYKDSSNVAKDDFLHVNYHEALKLAFEELRKKGEITPEMLQEKCKNFDKLGNGKIKLYNLLNVLKHNLPEIDSMILAGLQYELTLLHPDEIIDFAEFFAGFAESAKEQSNIPDYEVKRQEMKSKYDKILDKINDFTIKNKINLQKAFQIFDSNNDNRITKEEFFRSFEWLDMPLTKEEIDCVYEMANKTSENKELLFLELLEAIKNSGNSTATYNRQQWISAAKGISMEDQCRVIAENYEQLEFLIQKEYPQSKQLIPGEVFTNCLRDANFGLSEEEIGLVTMYAIRGSKRLTPEQCALILSTVSVDVKKDLINLPFFKVSLDNAFKEMPKMKTEKDASFNKLKSVQAIEKAKLLAQKKETELVNKIKSYFTKTGLSFYNYFVTLETGFLQSQLQYRIINNKCRRVTRKQVMDAVHILKIPLSLQEKRIVIQLEDPLNKNNISVRLFCDRFETNVFNLNA